MKLREYQKEQLNFLEKKTGIMKGLQSPTGTGKSIVLLSYIKKCIEENLYRNIVLTTGFNELVFQMADDAKALDMTPRVIIGSGYIIPNCGKDVNIYPDFKFAKTQIGACSNCSLNSPRRKRYDSICSKKCIMNYLNTMAPKFIITNHSYFLVMKDYINADLVVVDEAQTFGDFYMSYNSVTINEEEKNILWDYCNRVITPSSQILKMSLTKGLGLNISLINNVVRELKSFYKDAEFEVESFGKKLESIFSQKSFDNYLEETNGEYIKSKFFSSYDINSKEKTPDVIITSATLDSYTLKMFGCTNKNQIYIQREDRNRYKGSYFISNYKQYREGLQETLELVRNNYKSDSGLILCSSIESVNWTLSFLAKNFKDINVFTNSKDFKECKETKILVGSKKFYQGINLPDLDYVFMDKLPFSPYDDKFQAYSYYIEKVTKENAWKGYTLPLMFNAFLQGMGRLWRKNDIENGIYDQGIFAIFDSRLEKKFNYIEKKVVEMKPGIEIIQLNKSKEEEPKEEPKNKKVKIKGKEITPEEFDELIQESIKSL